MPRLYSPEWVAEFNRAVTGLDVRAVDTGTSLVASGGRFQVDQVVHDAPDGEILVRLSVTRDTVALSVTNTDHPFKGGAANVTIALSYQDAAAVSEGALDAAGAIGEGRVRVRGDLSVLAAAQALLTAARERLGPLRATTTY